MGTRDFCSDGLIFGDDGSLYLSSLEKSGIVWLSPELNFDIPNSWKYLYVNNETC